MFTHRVFFPVKVFSSNPFSFNSLRLVGIVLAGHSPLNPDLLYDVDFFDADGVRYSFPSFYGKELDVFDSVHSSDD